VTDRKSVSESLLVEKKILFLEKMYVCEWSNGCTSIFYAKLFSHDNNLRSIK